MAKWGYCVAFLAAIHATETRVAQKTGRNMDQLSFKKMVNSTDTFDWPRDHLGKL